MSGRQGLSCVICTYNEAARIGAVLAAVARHPLIDQLIVVDDGSTDGTGELLRGVAGVALISYPENRGKAFALSQGLAAASCDYVMLLDADLCGLAPEHITQLALPVITGEADVSVSLRSNSLALYKAIGLDFVSGERVLPRHILEEALTELQGAPGWAAEVLINELIIRAGLRLAVVRWKGVANTRKAEKVGPWRGLAEDLRMVHQAAGVLSAGGALRQNMQLLRLARPSRPGVAPPPPKVLTGQEGV